MLKKLSVAAIALVAVLGGGPVALAQEGETSGRPAVLNKVENKVESTVKTVENSEPNGTVKSAREQVRTQQQQIEDRKAELKKEREARVAERKERLEGRRLAQCQNRQDDINKLLTRSVDNGRERLAKIQRFEEGVKSFYEKKELSSDAYDTTLAVVDEKEAAAIVALDNIADQPFSCDDVDATKPSDAIRANHEAKHVALKEYRQSVVELIKVVKAAFAASQSEVKTDE